MTPQQLAAIVVVGLTGVAALGCAVVGGVFYAFSSFVMRGLAVGDGLRAMQGINRAAVRAPLMLPLFGTVLVGLVASILLVVVGSGNAVWWAVAGELVYLVGVVGVTIAFHVPRNEALDAIDPSAADAAAVWRRYGAEWARGNHLRSASGIAAAVLFGVAAGVVALHLMA
jgi:uncharacterized membrane protein